MDRLIVRTAYDSTATLDRRETSVVTERRPRVIRSMKICNSRRYSPLNTAVHSRGEGRIDFIASAQ